MHNDYFLTGDLGYKKEDGQFYFVDRKKDLIIKGGVNIVPGEVEEVLYQLKDIEVAAVIGIPDAIYGEDVVAFVKPVKNVQISEDEIRSYCLQHFQEFKCPKRVIIIDKKIERNTVTTSSANT
jgi:long-chain acyl-CoA synthetase